MEAKNIWMHKIRTKHKKQKQRNKQTKKPLTLIITECVVVLFIKIPKAIYDNSKSDQQQSITITISMNITKQK